MMFIITSIQTKDQAETLIDLLLDKKLIACGGYFPIQSRYNWNDKRHTNSEYRIEMETRDELYSELEKAILDNHPYDEPAIFSWSVNANKDCYDWVSSVT